MALQKTFPSTQLGSVKDNRNSFSWKKNQTKNAIRKKFCKPGSANLHYQLPSARAQRGMLPLRNHVFKLAVDEIFEATQYHVTYTHFGATLKGLAKYNDSTPYNISEKVESDLVRLEIERLVAAAEKPTEFLFDSQQVLRLTDNGGFEDIANVADQLKCSLGIVRLDNARISLEHCENGIDDTIHNFRHARMRLIGRFSKNKSHVQGSEPKLLEPPSRNELLYYALINYITACVARMTVRIADGAYWNQQILSCLASCTVKVKILSNRPAEYANRSTETAEHAIEEMTQNIASKEATLLKIRVGSDAAAKSIDTLTTETDVSSRYHAEKTLFNKFIWGMIRQVLYSLLISDNRSSSASCLETHAAVVSNSREDGTTVSSGRMSEISASSDSFCIKSSSTALDLVLKNIKAIKAELESSPHRDSSFQEKTNIKWEWKDSETEGQRPETISTPDANHVLSVVIPLSLASTFVSMRLLSLVAVAGSGAADEDPVRQFDSPSSNFNAAVTVTTSNWTTREQNLAKNDFQDDTRTLSKSPLRLGIRAETREFESNIIEQSSAYNSHPDETARFIREYNKNRRKMLDWVIADDSVTIKCHGYITAVVALALAIICGGIAIPFSVAERIRGVDPFQLTTFAWILAGFITILAKSRYVSEWPWHDFIHGRVICRSVKDICDVSGLKPQTVLRHLLREEKDTELRTKGPFNSMFSRRTNDTAGFAIDEAAHISTMLTSGFIVLKVVNEFGEHLICLDIRQQSESIHVGEASERLCCMFLEKYDEPIADQKVAPDRGYAKAQSHRLGKVKRLGRYPIRINRVVGLYIGDSYFG